MEIGDAKEGVDREVSRKCGMSRKSEKSAETNYLVWLRRFRRPREGSCPGSRGDPRDLRLGSWAGLLVAPRLGSCLLRAPGLDSCLLGSPRLDSYVLGGPGLDF